MLSITKKKIICALDFNDSKEAMRVAGELPELVGMFKVGLELYTTIGPTIISQLYNTYKIPIFLDLKLHDIPNTIYKTVHNFCRLNSSYHIIEMLTVHAIGEEKMIRAAVMAAGGIDVIAVTGLTSLNSTSLATVIKYTEIALNAGAAGIVCSVQEASKLRKKFGNDFKIVVPGIRPEWYNVPDDQERTGTPAEAIKSGANYIVVGRPITYSTNPRDAAYNINKEIETVSK